MSQSTYDRLNTYKTIPSTFFLFLPAFRHKQYRVVIKKFEVFDTSGEADTPHKEERQLIYADTLPIKR